MAGYVMADVEVTDPELFREYQKLVEATVTLYGGRYLVRGGDSEVLEGDRVPNRSVILEFDSVKRAREWYNSDEYAPALGMRLRATNSSVIIVEGV